MTGIFVWPFPLIVLEHNPAALKYRYASIDLHRFFLLLCSKLRKQSACAVKYDALYVSHACRSVCFKIFGGVPQFLFDNLWENSN